MYARTEIRVIGRHEVVEYCRLLSCEDALLQGLYFS